MYKPKGVFFFCFFLEKELEDPITNQREINDRSKHTEKQLI